MIDAQNFTNHNPSDHELQEMFLFAVSVAGKPSRITEEKVNALLADIQVEQMGSDPSPLLFPHFGPLEYLVWLGHEHFMWLIKKHKLGKYSLWSKMWRWFNDLVMPSIPDLLRTAEIEDLEKIPGVRFKTSRFFVLHSRDDAECVPLDTHILRFLRDRGVPAVPNVTPGSGKAYAGLEKIAVEALKSLGFENLAQADIETWKAYSAGYQAFFRPA